MNLGNKKSNLLILLAVFIVGGCGNFSGNYEEIESSACMTNDWGLIFNKNNEDNHGSTGKMNYGNDTYNVVKIGTQWWMAENLKTAIYNDLTDIPNVTDDTWGNLTTGAWSYYNNTTSNGNTYGKLYNWYSVNTGKLCPQDWSVPSSNTNWATLIDYLGGTNVAGGKL